MNRTIIKSIFVAVLFLLAIPVGAYAHEWDDGYCESNNDGETHTHYYFCWDCGKEYSDIEYCTWESDGYYSYNYGEDGHYLTYECPLCYGTKKEYEPCSWRLSDKYYSGWDNTEHKITYYYECSKCGNSKKKVSYKRHLWTDWVIDYEADCTETGSKERTCEKCDKIETETIPAKGHAWGSWKVAKKNSPYHTGKKYRKCKRCEKKQYKTTPKRKATAKEKASMKTVKRFFVAAKTHNTPKMKTYFAKYPKNYFAYKNSLLGKWSRKYNKTKMSWKIKDVQTSGSTVSVKSKR